jgi:hypothetical protein
MSADSVCPGVLDSRGGHQAVLDRATSYSQDDTTLRPRLSSDPTPSAARGSRYHACGTVSLFAPHLFQFDDDKIGPAILFVSVSPCTHPHLDLDLPPESTTPALPCPRLTSISCWWGG